MIPREIIAAEGDRPSQVGSHYHSNLLRTGTVRLIPFVGNREIHGLRPCMMGRP